MIVPTPVDPRWLRDFAGKLPEPRVTAAMIALKRRDPEIARWIQQREDDVAFVLRTAADTIELRRVQAERDRFARAALTGLLAQPIDPAIVLECDRSAFNIAATAFDIADAMLAESERRATPNPAEEQAGGST